MQIELHSVSKAFGRTRALDRVSLSIAPGQIVAVLGANGAGKTTLLRMVAGLLRPDQGEVLYDGKAFHADDLPLRRRLFFLPDFPIHFAQESVLHSIGMMLRLYEADGPEAPAKVAHWLEAFDLVDLAERPVHTLSRGQSYKAALVALFTLDPELWLLDEPLASGMDPQGLSTFRRQAREAASRGRTLLYTTQLLESAERFADRACVLSKGEVAVFESMETLRQRSTGSEDGILAPLLESPKTP